MAKSPGKAFLEDMAFRSPQPLGFKVNAEGGWNSFDFVLVLFAYLELVAARRPQYMLLHVVQVSSLRM